MLAALAALERTHGGWAAEPAWELAPEEDAVVGEAEDGDGRAPACGEPQRWVLGSSAAASAERAARLRYVREKSVPGLRWAMHQVGLLLEHRRRAAGSPPRVLLDLDARTWAADSDRALAVFTGYGLGPGV